MGLPSKGLPRGCSWVCPARVYLEAVARAHLGLPSKGLPRGCSWVCPARVYLEAVGGSAQQGFT